MIIRFSTSRACSTSIGCPCFAPGDIVIDVAAHPGSFADAAPSRGCENVTASKPTHEFRDRGGVLVTCYRKRSRAGGSGALRGGPTGTPTSYALTAIICSPSSYPGLEGVLNTGNGSVIWPSERERHASHQNSHSTKL